MPMESFEPRESAPGPYGDLRHFLDEELKTRTETEFLYAADVRRRRPNAIDHGGGGPIPVRRSYKVMRYADMLGPTKHELAQENPDWRAIIKNYLEAVIRFAWQEIAHADRAEHATKQNMAAAKSAEFMRLCRATGIPEPHINKALDQLQATIIEFVNSPNVNMQDPEIYLAYVGEFLSRLKITPGETAPEVETVSPEV